MVVRTDSAVRRELADEANTTGLDIQRQFKRVVQDWHNKPRFVMRISVSDREISVVVEPEAHGKAANIWRWVDRGTGKYGPKRAPYVIAPKRTNKAGLLKFRTNYSPRTVPVAKFGKGSGSASGPWRSVKKIIHPGIKARLFTKTIVNKLNPSFKKRIDYALRRAVRRAT